MSFKKLVEPLKESLLEKEILEPNAFQKKAIPRIKSGSNVFGIAPKGSGKTTTLIINTIQKLKGKAEYDVPRVIIFVENKDKAIALEEEFKFYMRGTDLRIYSVYEGPVIDHQLGEIYPGIDIIIATPKRLNKVYFLNGINLTKIQLLIVEDAEFLRLGTNHTLVNRIFESANSAQCVVFAEKFDDKIERLGEIFMENGILIK
jgi:superfamily II DNA/RNA helicase